MPKCYLHRNIVQSETTDKDKDKDKPKPKTHPGHPEPNTFQQNLEIILAPKKAEPYLKPYYHQEFTELRSEKNDLLKKTKEQGKIHKQEKQELLNQFAAEKIILENEIAQQQINYQYLQQKKAEEIAEKDNRNAQLHELFKGTANIFNKQHNYVDKLKEELEKEKTEKGISEEQIKHLEKDVEIYLNWKNELQENEKKLLAEIAELKKKPTTAEAGTQTTLTAQEISQMETDLKEKTAKITELEKSKNELTEQINKQEGEIKEFKERVGKIEAINPTERRLLEIEIKYPIKI
jgi:chromosome segregation ATPase